MGRQEIVACHSAGEYLRRYAAPLEAEGWRFLISLSCGSREAPRRRELWDQHDEDHYDRAVEERATQGADRCKEK